MAVGRIVGRNVERHFGRTRVLTRASFELLSKQSILLLGQNGAGKSTLLSLLAGLDRPDGGEILLDDAPLGLDHRREIGFLAHDSRCYADLTAHENLLLVARLCGVPDAAQAAAEMVKHVDLVAAADRPARTYSRGMLQRLALGRALIHRPSVLLLDEPFTGLDRESQERLRTTLLAERARGTLLCLVSHDLQALDGICDRVLGIRRGRVEELAAAGAARSAAELIEIYAAYSARS